MEAGAFIEKDEVIMPDATDEAMSKRMQVAAGDGVIKEAKPEALTTKASVTNKIDLKEVKDNA